MKQEIKEILNSIQEKENFKILFAIEAGSRVWRIPSKNSDYDIRFVYAREVKEYLRLNKLPEVIQRLEKEKNLDFVGFDIYKFSKLLLSSNPSMIEWLNSDIIYMNNSDTKEAFRKFIEKKFNPVALYHHNKSSCKNNYLKYLKSGEKMTHKKYLYAMRGLLNAKWVIQFNTIPPIDFNKTIRSIRNIPSEVLDKLKEIIKLKEDGFEEVRVSKISLFEKYIEDWLQKEEEVESRRIIDYKEVQEHIYDIVGDKDPLNKQIGVE